MYWAFTVDDQESRPSKRCDQGIIFTIKRPDPGSQKVLRWLSLESPKLVKYNPAPPLFSTTKARDSLSAPAPFAVAPPNQAARESTFYDKMTSCPVSLSGAANDLLINSLMNKVVSGRLWVRFSCVGRMYRLVLSCLHGNLMSDVRSVEHTKGVYRGVTVFGQNNYRL